MGFVIVGIGGIFGSLTRYQLARLINSRTKRKFPFATFIINITGALLLGILVGLSLNRTAGLLLADGFLGAYTTFSTFMYEGVTLFKGNQRLNAAVYIAASLIIGVAGFIVGEKIGIMAVQ